MSIITVTLSICNFSTCFLAQNCWESRDASFYTNVRSWGQFFEKLWRKQICHTNLRVICDLLLTHHPQSTISKIIWPTPGLTFVMTILDFNQPYWLNSPVCDTSTAVYTTARSAPLGKGLSNRPGKIHNNEKETAFLSWEGSLYKYTVWVWTFQGSTAFENIWTPFGVNLAFVYSTGGLRQEGLFECL